MPDPRPEPLPHTDAGELPESVVQLLNAELTSVRILRDTSAHLVRTSGPGQHRTLCGVRADVTWPAYGAVVSGKCGGCVEVATDVADALAVLHREREAAGGIVLPDRT